MRASTNKSASWSKRITLFLYDNWLLVVSAFFTVLVSLPFLAPIFMKFNLMVPARIIYSLYSFLCHQLPQRSYFLFGKQLTYSLSEIKSVWSDTNNPLILRQFIGSHELGWKVAWSDRMVAINFGLVFILWFRYFRKNFSRLLSWRNLLLIAFPMAVDGFTHLFSDFAGLGLGFRDSNQWLAAITNNAFSPTFYSGDGWGSFNSIARLATGFIFGAGIVWLVIPSINELIGELKIKLRD